MEKLERLPRPGINEWICDEPLAQEYNDGKLATRLANRCYNLLREAWRRSPELGARLWLFVAY
jgi:hypothetical protein